MSLEKSNQNIEFIFDSPDEFDGSFKIVIIGDKMVGKTALAKRITQNIFEEKYNETYGAFYSTFCIKIKDKILKLNIYDLPSNQKFKPIIKAFMKDSNLAILLYDITNLESFENIEFWLQELNNYSLSSKVILVGNKTDLNDERKIPEEEGRNKINLKIRKFIECSVKNNTNVKEIFIETADLLYPLIDSNSEDKKKAIKKEKNFCCFC